MSFASRATGSFVSSMRDSRVFLRPRTTAALTDTARCARADASPLSVMDGPLAPSRATAVAQRSKHSHEVGWWGGHMTGDAPKWKGGGQYGHRETREDSQGGSNFGVNACHAGSKSNALTLSKSGIP